MKVFINNRDYLTWPRNMSMLLAKQGHQVLIVDNDSSYPPLLEFYDSISRGNYPGIEVFKLKKNGGPYSVWEHCSSLIPNDCYVVTDPDLDISAVPIDWPEVLQEGLKLSGALKCGLSLDERLTPKDNPAYKLDEFNKYSNNDHPSRWNNFVVAPSGKKFHKQTTDTTFALYRPGELFGYVGGTRADAPYMARHLPWHLVDKFDPDDFSYQIVRNEETEYYFSHAAESASTTKKRYVGWKQ